MLGNLTQDTLRLALGALQTVQSQNDEAIRQVQGLLYPSLMERAFHKAAKSAAKHVPVQPTTTKPKHTRIITPEGRRKLALAAKKRWVAARKAGKHTL
jgi:hypothetical protein